MMTFANESIVRLASAEDKEVLVKIRNLFESDEWVDVLGVRIQEWEVRLV